MINCPLCNKDISETKYQIYNAVESYKCKSCRISLNIVDEKYYEMEPEFEDLVDTIKQSMLHDNERFEAGEECFTEHMTKEMGVTDYTLSRAIAEIYKRREEYKAFGRDAKLLEGCLHILGHIELKDWAEGCLDVVRAGLTYEDKDVGVFDRALMCVENSESKILMQEIDDLEIKTDWLKQYRDSVLMYYVNKED